MSGGVDSFAYALVALLVIIDPAGTAVMFIGLSPGDTTEQRAQMARRACVIAFIVLAVFGVAGEVLLRALGIGLAAMRAAGGVLLFLTAADMVTAKGVLRATADERAAAVREHDIAVFPLAIPFIAGPGAMTTMVLLHAQANADWRRIAMVTAALAAAIAVTFVALAMARQVSRLLGATGANVVGRVLGVLLAALAAQMVLDGVRESLGLGQ
jgi:multiple antibiotic resistance protein